MSDGLFTPNPPVTDSVLHIAKARITEILGANKFGISLEAGAIKLVICKSRLSEKKLHDFFGFYICGEEQGSNGIGVWDTGEIYHFASRHPDKLCDMVRSTQESAYEVAVGQK
ncbi:MAG: hypothetical protein ABIJ81_02940 [Patescibacteria group bacterium]